MVENLRSETGTVSCMTQNQRSSISTALIWTGTVSTTSNSQKLKLIYKIAGEKISFDFEKLNINHGGPFFDTGTTFLYLPLDLMSELTAQFTSHCSKEMGNCSYYNEFRECYYWDKKKYPVLNDFFRTFPILTFYFNQILPYKWYPQDYLVAPLDSNLHYCVGIKSLSHTILGALFMRNYDIYFDKTAKKIGFIRSNCGSDPYFIDNFNDKPAGSSGSRGNTSPQEVISDKNGIETEHAKVEKRESSGFRNFVLSLVLIAILLAALILLRYLYKLNRETRDIKNDVNTSQPVRLEEVNA